MDSIKDISKEKDIIRILGRMPDTVMDKDSDDNHKDILELIYEVRIGSQENLYTMLQNAGYQTTKGDTYTAVLIGDNVSENTISSIPNGSKKIDIYSIASWLVDNKIAVKEYTNKQNSSSTESTQRIEKKENNPIWVSILVGIVAIAGVVCLFPIFIVIILFVPGALNKFVHLLIK